MRSSWRGRSRRGFGGRALPGTISPRIIIAPVFASRAEEVEIGNNRGKERENQGKVRQEIAGWLKLKVRNRFSDTILAKS